MDGIENLQTLRTVLSIFAFVLGGMVGSFLNVCVYRLPKGESVVKPRSKCHLAQIVKAAWQTVLVPTARPEIEPIDLTDHARQYERAVEMRSEEITRQIRGFSSQAHRR